MVVAALFTQFFIFLLLYLGVVLLNYVVEKRLEQIETQKMWEDLKSREIMQDLEELSTEDDAEQEEERDETKEK